MGARCAALALAWCAPAAAPPSAPVPCDPLTLKKTPPLPPNVREYEAAVAQTARALSEQQHLPELFPALLSDLLPLP